MRKLALKVSDKEVRSIGEMRWFRANWKGWLPLMIVCLAATIVIMAVIPGDTAGWIVTLVIFPFVVGLLTSYCCLLKVMDKAGRDFLEEVRGGQ